MPKRKRTLLFCVHEPHLIRATLLKFSIASFFYVIESDHDGFLFPLFLCCSLLVSTWRTSEQDTQREKNKHKALMKYLSIILSTFSSSYGWIWQTKEREKTFCLMFISSYRFFPPARLALKRYFCVGSFITYIKLKKRQGQQFGMCVANIC